MMFGKKQYDDDDGRTIINMDVEGMRWFDRTPQEDNTDVSDSRAFAQMTRGQVRLYTWYSLLAASGIVLVFGTTWILFTLFCIYVWFR